MKKLLIVLIICSLCLLLQDNVVSGDKVVEENCVCSIIVECHFPGYRPGTDLPFASQTVSSCAEAEEYMQYISETVEYSDGVDIPKSSTKVFFYIYHEKPK